MTIEIRHRHTQGVLHTVEAEDLRGADLYGANLRGAVLREAVLYGADLRAADLREAYLYGADLRAADLGGADLRDADLYGANLRDADLGGADLRRASLEGADLRSADLRRASLGGADLRDADLGGANGLEQFVIAAEGALTGYKYTNAGTVTLEIPRSAGRVNAYGSRKCRAEYAVVVQAPPGAVSLHDGRTAYVVGETVRPDFYDPDPRVECSHGIHFFLTRAEAEAYR